MAASCVIISDSEGEGNDQLPQVTPVKGTKSCTAVDQGEREIYDDQDDIPSQGQTPELSMASPEFVDDFDDCDDDFDIFSSKLKNYTLQKAEANRQVMMADSRRWANARAAADDVDTSICLTPQSPLLEVVTPVQDKTSTRRRKRRGSSPNSCSSDAVLPPVKRKGSLLSMLNQFISDESPGKDGEKAVSEKTEESQTFTVRVQAGSRIIRRQMRKDEELRSLFEHVAAAVSVPVSRVCLGQREVVYRPDQTPDDVQLGIFDVIEFWEGESAAAPEQPDGAIELHVQSAQRRSKLALWLLPTQTMQELMQMYAARRGLPLSKLRFRFDGEALNPTETPESLGLEEGDCIDVHE